MIQIRPQKAFFPLYSGKYREISYSGGRGSAKSYSFADLCIIKALEGKRVLCLREVQNSISESVYALLCDRIDTLGISEYFTITSNEISCKSGGLFLFKGLQRNIDSIKSMHNIEVVWIEEAQTVSKDSLIVLIATIYRNNDPLILYSWNPRYEDDAVYQRFIVNELPPKSYHCHVTWKDNKYFSEDMKEEMDFNYRTDPEMAAHIWEGALYPSSSDCSVIPMSWLKRCVGAHLKLRYENHGYDYLGFDVADTGKDHSCIAHRKGALLCGVEEFDNNYISDAVEKVHKYAVDNNIIRLFFDASGLGAGAKSDFNRLHHDYIVEPFVGGSRPNGYDKEFLNKITNGQYFRNLKAQAWWNLRVRAENTLRLLDGENIILDNCLFISENITNINKLLLELSQATYKHEDSKLIVDKQPERGQSSPNMADAVVLSFAFDIKKGLRSK